MCLESILFFIYSILYVIILPPNYTRGPDLIGCREFNAKSKCRVELSFLYTGKMSFNMTDMVARCHHRWQSTILHSLPPPFCLVHFSALSLIVFTREEFVNISPLFHQVLVCRRCRQGKWDNMLVKLRKWGFWSVNVNSTCCFSTEQTGTFTDLWPCALLEPVLVSTLQKLLYIFQDVNFSDYWGKREEGESDSIPGWPHGAQTSRPPAHCSWDLNRANLSHEQPKYRQRIKCPTKDKNYRKKN